jgi:hypothetical protein
VFDVVVAIDVVVVVVVVAAVVLVVVAVIIVVVVVVVVMVAFAAVVVVVVIVVFTVQPKCVCHVFVVRLSDSSLLLAFHICFFLVTFLPCLTSVGFD